MMFACNDCDGVLEPQDVVQGDEVVDVVYVCKDCKKEFIIDSLGDEE